MDTNQDDAKKDGPPPPDIKTGSPPPPVPGVMGKEKESESEISSAKGEGFDVTIKEDDGGGEEGVEEKDESRPGLGERVGGFLIDVLVCVGILVVISMIMPFDFLDNIATLGAIGYLLTRDSLPFLNGQSLGKKAVGLRVETLDGKGISENWQAGLLRNVALIVPPFWVVELVMLLTREDKPEAGLRLGDEWAKTRVVKVAPPVSDSEPEE